LADSATGMSIGRANAVFVFGRGENTTSIVSPVVVRVTDKSDTVRIRFTGSVSFDSNTVDHLFKSVLPTADKILTTIGLPKKNIEISIVNFEVAAIKDVESKISGFSADVPILIAILCACLNIHVQEDIVFTGHIASPDGDIRMVKNFPSKLSAVVDDRSIKTFIHPVIDADHSLSSVSPSEKRQIKNAVEVANHKIRLISIHDVEDLVRSVFNDHQIVMASMKQGFFGSPISRTCGWSPCTKAVDYITNNIEKRYWDVLESLLMSAKVYETKKMLQAFISFHINREIYPKLFGARLSNLIYSLPPEIRYFKFKYPLMPISKHIQLSQFAQDTDYEDLQLLFMAIFSENTWRANKIDQYYKTKNIPDAISQHDALQLILSEINKDKITFLIDMPIDLARDSYTVSSVIVKSSEEFNNNFTSFYIHLIRRTRGLLTSIDLDSSGADALDLLERATSQLGGYKGAFADAKCGKLRHILNLMTEQFKQEEKGKYINYVLKSTLGPMKWEVKVEVMELLLKKLKDHLPEKITSKQAEQLAANMDAVLITYSKSIDKITSLFRSF